MEVSTKGKGAETPQPFKTLSGTGLIVPFLILVLRDTQVKKTLILIAIFIVLFAGCYYVMFYVNLFLGLIATGVMSNVMGKIEDAFKE